MTVDRDENKIRYSGQAKASKAGREVMAFHLHRYLKKWLRRTGATSVMVSVGFSKCSADLGAYRISAQAADPVRTGWSHRDLEDAWRFNQGTLVWEGPDAEPISFDVVPIFDDDGADEESSSRQILGFATVRRERGYGPDEFEALAEQAAEAIEVARRNSVRLFFDEQKELPVKALLYDMMNQLPEWSGCDHSAAVLLTHDLDAMTLEDSTQGTFNVLGERLYFGATDDDGRPWDRLVGMAVDTDNEEDTSILSDALLRHRQQPEKVYLVYRRQEDGSWRYGDEGDQPLRPWYEFSRRPSAQSVALVPLVHRSRGERDLLGVLSLSWGGDFGLPPSIEEVLAELSTNLARHLRQSPLFSLSVRKMWLIRKVHQCIEDAVEHRSPGTEVVEEIIGSVSDLVAANVDVPSFAIGYLSGERQPRTVRYVHPHGWSWFDNLDLDVDVEPDDRVDSGISALAVRLERPVVLAGGHGEGATQEFKNHLWVDEEAKAIIDARSVGQSVEELTARGRPLRDYYKPARETAYATLAYPMVFANRIMGVLTVEVEKQTDWLWWTGFGGHLFWDMVAREVAMGIYWLKEKR